MAFYISFKYSILTIFKSKIFILLSTIFIGIIFLVNLILGLIIKFNENQISNIFVLHYVNVIMVMVSLVMISLLFSYDFFYTQKKNGIKTLEVKNGMKIWQIFISKMSALILIILVFSIIVSTIIVIENLIIFKENIYVIKLIFINLYLVFLVPLFIFSLNLLMLCLNWKKITLIFSGFFLGVLSAFWLVNAVLYEFASYNLEGQGYNELGTSNYRIYFNYYIRNFKKKIEQENKILEELKIFGEDNKEMQELVYYDKLDKSNPEEELKDIEEYYENFKNYNYFYSSGTLFYNVELFNLINKTFLKNQEDYVEAKYDKEIINKSFLLKALYDFDIEKTKVDLFEGYNRIVNTISVLKETKNYIYKLENYFKSNEKLSSYYNDLKEINKLILDIYEKGFYFKDENYFLSNGVGNIDKYFQRFFKSPLDKSTSFIEKRKATFDLQTISSGKSAYQAILFYIINNYDENKINRQNSHQPRTYVMGFSKMLNYYTSPFLWSEFLSKFGFVKKTFDNITVIDYASFIRSHSYFRVDFEIDENDKDRYVIKDYVYKGPITSLLIVLIIIYCAILIGLSFWFYKINFYK